ncbi:MAG: hypothetical protein O4751_13710 [Trichodesmium sp. St2_bin6]|nr:hypothetical protein [Trichodesmium sp. St2_bin6]
MVAFASLDPIENWLLNNLPGFKLSNVRLLMTIVSFKALKSVILSMPSLGDSKKKRSTPLPPVRISLPLPPTNISFPLLPISLSLPPFPSSLLFPRLPRIMFLRLLPIPSTSSFPMRVRFSKLLLRF